MLLSLCIVLMTAVSYNNAADFHIASAIKWGFRLTIAMMVVGVTYGALTTLCSSLARTNGYALFINIIALIVLLFLRLVGNLWHIPGHQAQKYFVAESSSMLGVLRYLTPAEFAPALLSSTAIEFAAGLVAHAGFICILLGLAQVAMKRRDV